ncbi:MAG: hypothetical protein KZQ93_14725 [Candidatus Thiodiazotropha sp. (ex Monitilora ramsayi)]|nr:hypothetical protein [Candidatus Thiodiazotropha sp. (ex Monitilora ramsayi)]
MPHKELKKFAQWFNQDFEILFESTEDGVNTYLNSLSESELNTLAIEIDQFLQEHPGKDCKGLKNAWIKLGAQWWDKKELPQIFYRLTKVREV